MLFTILSVILRTAIFEYYLSKYSEGTLYQKCKNIIFIHGRCIPKALY